MKLTPQETAFFRDLSKTETGRILSTYMKRVVDHIYDSRSWQEGDTKESAKHAARLLNELVIEKIRLQGQPGTTVSEFE